MATYTVKWDYASAYGGPWKKNDRIELEGDLADLINRDSPGVLVRYKPRPSRDRQVKAAPKARAGAGKRKVRT